MKSYFEQLKESTIQLINEGKISNNNGTQGLKLRCWVFKTDSVGTDETKKLEQELAKAVLSNDSAKVEQINAQIDALPVKKRAIIHLKLVEPIDQIIGSKRITGLNGKIHNPVMKNVTQIEMGQDYLFNNTINIVETGDMEKDIMGNDVPIVELSLDKALIEVTEPIYNYNRLIVPKRAYVTAVSAQLLQTLGSIVGREDRDNERIKRLAE